MIVSERGFLEPPFFPERRVVGLLSFAQMVSWRFQSFSGFALLAGQQIGIGLKSLNNCARGSAERIWGDFFRSSDFWENWQLNEC